MKIKELLENIKAECTTITYFCSIHMLEKNFDIENDTSNKENIKEFFINYENYEKYLNDYAGVIYKKFESSIDNVYNEICLFFGENPDNKYLFSHRIKRVLNQNPMKYLDIENEDLRDNAIYKIEEKISIIEKSFYYKENKQLAYKELEKLKKSINMVKVAAGIK
ncbi:hypothetical protein [Arcobacter sp.]|uniref:hypothetical protein n=1 Tax=Arcobacter sp. TaxID=1872629 RepID=UPI003D0CAD4A